MSEPTIVADLLTAEQQKMVVELLHLAQAVSDLSTVEVNPALGQLKILTRDLALVAHLANECCESLGTQIVMKPRCLVCRRGAYSRGLCNSHYQDRVRQVRRKETTWESLVARQLALPPRKR